MNWIHSERFALWVVGLGIGATALQDTAAIAGNLGLGREYAIFWAWLALAPVWIQWPVLVLYGAGRLVFGLGTVTVLAVASGLLLTGALRLIDLIFEVAATLTEALCLTIAGFVRVIPMLAWMLLQTAALTLLVVIGQPLYWRAEALGGQLVRLAARPREIWRERQDLRRLYRAEYRDDFPNFRAFKRAWDACQRGEDIGDDAADDEAAPAPPPPPDPLEWAIGLLGLAPAFTRDDLESRYRRLMKGVHPDAAGPNALAEQLNRARALINERKGWP